VTGAIFEVAEENCLVRPASLDVDAGGAEDTARKDSVAEGLVEARVAEWLGTELAETLISLRSAMDITSKKQAGAKEGAEMAFKTKTQTATRIDRVCGSCKQTDDVIARLEPGPSSPRRPFRQLRPRTSIRRRLLTKSPAASSTTSQPSAAQAMTVHAAALLGGLLGASGRPLSH
jgi:hypothetical protein